MLVLNSKQVKRLDRRAEEEFGLSTLILMENAGREVARLASELVGPKRNILVVCGMGNNGGDGFVTARHLNNMGFSVTVVLVGTARKLKADPKVNFLIVKRMKIPILELTEEKLNLFGKLLGQSGLIIDAIFGIGLSRPVSGIYFGVISKLNQSQKKILSVDIPSGLDSDSGKVMAIAVKAAVTGTLAVLKPGLIKADGPKFAGRVKVLDISIPRRLLK